MKKLLKSFVYAFEGVLFCLKNEQNMRIHLCFTVYMFGFLTVYDFFEISKTQYAVLIALCALVFGLEAVNTAVERVVDLATKEYSPLAKAAKDACAGAVLLAAAGAVAAGIVIMYQPEAFAAMLEYYKANLPVFLILLLSVAASLVFVFAGPTGIKNFFKKHIK